MKKFLKVLSVILLTGIIFSACQKEYDIIDGTATGTLKEDASGDCMPVVINGIYTANVNVGAANFVDLQVNIDNIGTYDISTDTVNSYFFHAAGSVAITGLNTIRLQASGKPIISGTDIFRVKFSGTACELNVSVAAGGPGGGGGSAVFTLRAATTGAACTGAVQSGAYNQGLATSSSNTVTVFADVTTAGNYTATTTTVNGVSFSGSGTLVVGTNQPIVLTANGGTPTAANTFNYPVTAATSTCNFNVVYGATLPQATITPDCSSVTVNGTYQAGTAMTSMNTILVPVTVTTPGAYTITTATQNGVSFSGSGVVTAGTTSIILTASATTPTAAGTFTYPLTINGTSSCSVSVTYTASTGTGGFITCKINGVAKTFNVNISGSYITNAGVTSLDIEGEASTTTTENIDFGLQLPGTSIPPGDYNANATTYIAGGEYIDNAGNDYRAFGSATTNPTPVFTLHVTSITVTGGVTFATGTFTGNLNQDGTGPGFIPITEGAFNVHF